ncbi:tRNA (cytosine(32)/uridine(32)-2'-O)-methyltransferase TrmJ [Acidiferrobacter sp. SPIII_3]|nr:tRNA (cytosine(32)/uridine(32)-2'-O)-methyltransferase TrmJ [Acidiferrobacter sp. SPIII_3]
MAAGARRGGLFVVSMPDIRIILVRPQHPGNIGACARAMKNMGLKNLVLVAPQHFPAEEAVARAAGADDILAAAAIVADVRAAVADCVFVAATSARTRTIALPRLDARGAAATLCTQARSGPVGLLFGAERTGLTNEEVDYAHALVQIPVDPGFASLNLAAAVQILCYEIRCTIQEPVPIPEPDHRPAPQEAFNRFLGHLEQVITDIGFLNERHPRKLMRRLTRLFRRAHPDDNELQILRGILNAVQHPYPPRPGPSDPDNT